MIILSTQDLEDYGVQPSSITMMFMGKLFARVKTFEQSLRDRAIAAAEQSLCRGESCLLTDSDTHITLWLEVEESVFDSVIDSSRSLFELSESEQAASYVTMKYRGQIVKNVQLSSQTSSDSSPEPFSQSMMPPSAPPSETKPRSQSKIRYRGRLVDAD